MLLLEIVLSVAFGVTITSAAFEAELLQVSIQYNNKPIGVGTIVHPLLVLTTWTLLENKSKSDLTVIVNSINQKVTHTIAEIISTKDDYYYSYEVKTLPNGGSRAIHDLALIKLNKAIDLESDGSPSNVTIPDKNYQPPDNTLFDLYGFEIPSMDVSMALMPIVNKEECNKFYEDEGGILDGEFCAGGENSSPPNLVLGPGDEGAPLVSGRDLIGIASAIVPCKKPNCPMIFMNTTRHSDWITGTMSGMLGSGDEWFHPTWEDSEFKRWLNRFLSGENPTCVIGPKKKKISRDYCQRGCVLHDMDFARCGRGNECICALSSGDRPLWHVLNGIETSKANQTCNFETCRYW
ncbi:hypothetical protein QAD02_010985 [Eretmocerus hayati]|uniref:Uncharacterized protein n=1 Tax=Eretmocerus hayati TaxID=131215 RepID=A0ACC2NY27_9HYME|nr:hypothetical protein QAD02_010985 [Eretmocerus hayati]